MRMTAAFELVVQLPVLPFPRRQVPPLSFASAIFASRATWLVFASSLISWKAVAPDAVLMRPKLETLEPKLTAATSRSPVARPVIVLLAVVDVPAVASEKCWLLVPDAPAIGSMTYGTGSDASSRFSCRYQEPPCLTTVHLS